MRLTGVHYLVFVYSYVPSEGMGRRGVEHLTGVSFPYAEIRLLGSPRRMLQSPPLGDSKAYAPSVWLSCIRDMNENE